MKTCAKCKKKPTAFENEGGLCTTCWWYWWFEDYSEQELERIIRENFFSAEEQNAAELMIKLRRLEK